MVWIRKKIIISCIISLITICGCSQVQSEKSYSTFPKGERFSEYWYKGKAELTRYDLQQVRYGEIHDGHAVMIFVTEDFLKDKQVKADYKQKGTTQSVLKLNFTRKFSTGIYPYSLMTSVFYPVYDYQNNALKISTTAQEWCGHTFMQLNNRNNKYQIKLNSYFQSDGDQNFEIEKGLLEDEIWTKIRINPDLLPEGNVQIIPGMQYARLLHKKFDFELATIHKSEINNSELSSNGLIEYSVEYQNISRTLKITFENDFPYAIVGWEESFKPLSVNVSRVGQMRTVAKRSKSILLDYWNKNSVADSTYRIALEGL